MSRDMSRGEAIGLTVLGLGVVCALSFVALGDWHFSAVGGLVAWAGAHVFGKAVEQPHGPVNITNHPPGPVSVTHHHHGASKPAPRGP